MNHREVAACWERNAHAWTVLSRQGWDVYRDALNTPAFLSMLPDVAGKRGIDIGCGEGHNTRLFAARGAQMFAVDISPTFVRYAAGFSAAQDNVIRYAVASAHQLPFGAGQFDFATAVMSLMDMPNPEQALCETYRVLRSGGFLQFSISHPCFNTPPHRRQLRAPGGEAYAVEVGKYFEMRNGDITRWLFSSAPPAAKAGLPPFETPIFHRTISWWFNSIRRAGFEIEEVAEPKADDETARAIPAVQDTQVVAYFLHVRCRKR